MAATRQGDLLVHSEEPLNAEPPLPLLRAAFVTPVGRFFARNHGPFPPVDEAMFRLEVGGLVERPLALSMEALRRDFPRREVTATLQCAGNRRTELMAVAPIPGEVAWEEGAISNGVWGGVALGDVLAAAGVGAGAAHAAFMGLDEVWRLGQSVGFGGSVPLGKALAPETLLAYEMNGAPLPLAHGGPLRVIAPGFIGARSVKWVATITLQPEPSANYFQAHAYKLFPSWVNNDNVDWAGGLMLGEMPITAVICSPSEGETLPAGQVRVAGYAVTGGGHCLARVDFSADSGETWAEAEIVEGCGPWAWGFWEAEVMLAPGSHELVVRAWDDAAHTQPEGAAPLWNFKGYMNHAWHRVGVQVT